MAVTRLSLLSKSNQAKSGITFDSPAFEALNQFQSGMEILLSGKPELVERISCALLSCGHLLLEDVPGVGKTTVVKGVAKLLGLEMMRIQCTSDLLPSDILGVQVYDADKNQFVFHEGPLFANVILVDELNRASPRTQSALLEAMGEGHVTNDRESYALPKPFLVFAAQNPSDHLGTYSLPDSQLDRFSAKLSLDYPEPEKELEIFSKASLDPVSELSEGQLNSKLLLELQKQLESVHLSESVAHYVKRFIDQTRKHEALRYGVSTRGGILWVRMARARALLLKRHYLIPDDLIELAPDCLGHRIIPEAGNHGKDLIQTLLSEVTVE